MKYQGWIGVTAILFFAWGVPIILSNYSSFKSEKQAAEARRKKEEYVATRWKTPQDVVPVEAMYGSLDSLAASLEHNRWPIYFDILSDCEFRRDSLHFESFLSGVKFSVRLEKSAQRLLASYKSKSFQDLEVIAPPGGLVVFLNNVQIFGTSVWAQGNAEAAQVPDFSEPL